MCFICRRHVIICSAFAFMLRYYPYICGPYTNILRANFVKLRTLLPFISCAFFDICSASVTMCRQNFVTCGEFLVMMTGRNIYEQWICVVEQTFMMIYPQCVTRIVELKPPRTFDDLSILPRPPSRKHQNGVHP